jgi:acetylornithine deacetylase/succinyl-diaminopimelate desuccinylase
MIENILDAVTPEEIDALTCRLVSIEGHEETEEREIPVAACLKKYLDEQGVPAELVPIVDGRSNVMARVKGKGGGPVLLLNGHTDTVPPYAMEDPFDGRVEGDRIRGRGSVDMKGALSSMAHVLVALARSGAELTGDVVLAATIGEEKASEGARQLMEDRFPADYVIVGEGTGLQVGVAHKGALRGEAVFEGRAVHSSVPEQGINAIYKASAWTERIVSEYIPSLEKKSHPLLGSPTMNLGVIEGGTRMSSVPDRCAIRFDRRMIPGENADELIAELQAIVDALAVEDPDVRGRVDELPEHREGPHPPLESDPAGPLVQALLSARETELGERSQPIGLVYWTDAALFAQVPGTQAVVSGPGDIAQAHTNDEWISRAQLHAAYRMYVRVAAELCM